MGGVDKPLGGDPLVRVTEELLYFWWEEQLTAERAASEGEPDNLLVVQIASQTASTPTILKSEAWLKSVITFT